MRSVEHRKAHLSWDHPLLTKHNLQLTELCGEEAINHGFTITFTVLSPQTFEFAPLLNQTATIKIEPPELQTRYFSGFITNISIDSPINDYIPYKISIQSWLQLLEQQTHCRIFQERSVIDIIRQIAQANADFRINSSQLNTHYPPIHYCVQYNETDAHFIRRILSAHGIHFYFSHHEDYHTLVLIDSFTPNASQHLKDPWLQQQQAPTGFEQRYTPEHYSSRHYDYHKPKSTHTAKFTHKTHGYTFSKPLEQYTYPSIHDSHKQIHQELVRRSHQNPATNKLTTGNHTITPASVVSYGDSNRSLRVLSIQHHAQQAPLKSIPHSEYRYEARVTAMSADQPYSPPQIKKPQMLNSLIACVCGPKQKTVYTDAEGRVKVRFYWDRASTSNTHSSCWIRVSELLAGHQWGTRFTPQIGTEVWVDFIDADPDQPVIVRQAHTPSHHAPLANKNPAVSAIRAPNEEPHLASNELRFDDNFGQENITITAQRDLIKQAKNSIHTQVRGNDTHHITHGNVSVMTHKGQYQLHAKKIHLQSGAQQIILEPDALAINGCQININCKASFSPLGILATAPMRFAYAGYGNAAVSAEASGTELTASIAAASTAEGAEVGAEVGALAGPLGALLGLALGGLIGFTVIEIKDHFKPSPRPITPPPKPPKQNHDIPKTTNPPPSEQPQRINTTTPPLESSDPITPPVYNNHQYHKPPQTLPAFPDAKLTQRKTSSKNGGGLRKRWKDKKHIYEWDSQHGKVEKYDKSGKRHLGEFDPTTGHRTKDPNPRRSVEK